MICDILVVEIYFAGSVALMLNENIKVSVVIPTYRRTVDCISNAVESVLNQTHQNIEIIVIDDSTDKYDGQKQTEDYFLKLNNPKVIYLQNEKNLGGSLSRNRGIEASTGEYITFLDDDDEYLPEKIEKQLDFMLKNKLELTLTDLGIYSPNGKLVDYREYSKIERFDNEYLLRYHLTNHMTGTPTFMFKANKLKEIGGFDVSKVGQEFRLMLKAIESGLKIGYLPECYVKAYRHPDGGISGGNNKIIGEKELYLHKQKYFHKLSKKEQRFVTFRYYAVLMAGYKRNKKYPQMVLYAVKTVLSSPIDFIKTSFNFVKKFLLHK